MAVVCLVGGGLALRVGLRLGGCVGVVVCVPDWFIAWTTALAASDARLLTGAATARGWGGTSSKPSYALLMYQLFFHLVLSWALCAIWLKARWPGTSMKIFPGDCMRNCARTATFRRRSPFSLRMWPSHLYLRLRMSFTRSYVLVLALASTCGLRPVILLRQRELAPLIAAIVG